MISILNWDVGYLDQLIFVCELDALVDRRRNDNQLANKRMIKDSFEWGVDLEDIEFN